LDHGLIERERSAEALLTSSLSEVARDLLEVRAQLEIGVADLLPIGGVFQKCHAELGGIGNSSDSEKTIDIRAYLQRVGALGLIIHADLAEVQGQALGGGVALDVRRGVEEVEARRLDVGFEFQKIRRQGKRRLVGRGSYLEELIGEVYDGVVEFVQR